MALTAWILAIKTTIDVYKLIKEELKDEETLGIISDDSLLARVRKLRDVSAKKTGASGNSNNKHAG